MEHYLESADKAHPLELAKYSLERAGGSASEMDTKQPRHKAGDEVRTESGSDRVSPRSGRQHKAWGVSPRIKATKLIIEPA
ncbi:MAG: hypothetical protein ACR2HX_02000 [Pyrinomonadaceae bacterium]